MKKTYFRAGLLALAISCLSNTYAKNNSLPGSGTEDEPYLIGSYEDLKLITGDLTAVYSITTNIDASASKTESETGWAPIGSTSAAFSGKIFGHGHKISNLYIKATVDQVGLFGYIAGGSIDSLAVTNATVTASSAASSAATGILVGYLKSGTVTNCASSGTITAVSFAGGLIGLTSGATIDKSYSQATVSGVTAIGGLVGSCNYASTLSNSFSTGNITLTGGIGGGLTGLMNGSLSNCYSRSNVTGGTANIGGLVGYGLGVTITNAYSTGIISSTAATAKGSVGYYNTAAVMNYPAASATGLFWDTTTSGKTATGLGTGKTTSDLKLQPTFATYDFTVPVWKINASLNDGYPYLAWQESTLFTAVDNLKAGNENLLVSSINGGVTIHINATSTGSTLELYAVGGAIIKRIVLKDAQTSITLPRGQYIGKLSTSHGDISTFKTIAL